MEFFWKDKRRLISFILAAFLIIYHSTKTYLFFTGSDNTNTPDFLNSFPATFPIDILLTVQVFLRLIIISSLVFVILNKKAGLIGMWLGIVSLVVTQFILSSNATSSELVAVHSGLAPLKGLIIPSVITILLKNLRQQLFTFKK